MKALCQINKFVNLPVKEKLWIAEAFFYLIWYSFLISIVPFRWWESRIGKKMQPIKHLEFNFDKQYRARMIRKSVLRANNLILGLGKCFAISLTIKKMLQKQEIDSTLHLGLRKECSNQLLAHAWVSCGKIVIYGGRSAPYSFNQILAYTQEQNT